MSPSFSSIAFSHLLAVMDGKGEDLPGGRVVVLEDTDHARRMVKSTVFATISDRREAWVQDQVRSIA